ncbi:unnamed protein product [Cladocopium goreaui]|uniref:Probable RNA 3'-terminal phosphate cyclase-like protein n=1 Tax=Cladocopium goreaui TaxID=2562237 RepID=A0A9P1DHV5_9DINO|nr:unnamed protein product [Cladocopium goreaui]
MSTQQDEVELQLHGFAATFFRQPHRLTVIKVVVESPFFTEDTEVDTAHQALVLYFLSLAEETKPSRVRLSRLSPAAAQMLRHIRDFLGVVFQIREDHGESGTVVLSCIGAGITNTARRTF